MRHDTARRLCYPRSVEIHEFAQRVLFSSTLEEKLAPAPALTDHQPGPAIGTPAAPGRPAGLSMNRRVQAAPFPKDPHLMDEEQRGLLLHFFCNHELLATELMALVLLKFPEAPHEFRTGIVQTLHEEQQHTRWYLERMAACGVRFGDFRLNGFFWENIAPMSTPLDYVTRLSLTFEQANLDYARHYSRVLREAGDPASAALLARIYRDEIGHVSYGLKWFRRWKTAGVSEWDAYRALLPFPLSPSRGKGGGVFNRTGRLRAGLSEEYVREIELFEQSRGRTPNVFWFNPHAEAAVAAALAGRSVTPRRAVAELALDLETLAGFLGHRDDLLLLSRPLPTAERERLKTVGLFLPQVETLTESGELPAAVRDRNLNGIKPWAWSPDAARLFRGLRHDPVPHALFSKTWALEFRQELGLEFGRVVHSADDLSGGRDLVLKAPYGTSAQKNLRWLKGEALTPALRRWIGRIVAEQGKLIVEPWVQRRHDFAAQYEMTADGLRRIALTHLYNDTRGQFVAASFHPKFGSQLDEDTARFLMEKHPCRPRLAFFDDELPAALAPRLRAAGFHGALGVDAFVHEQDGRLALQPVVEINPRYTMGRLVYELSRRVSPGRTVRLELVHRSRARTVGHETLESFAASLAPPLLDAEGKMCQGNFVLNDPREARQVLAVLTVGRQP